MIQGETVTITREVEVGRDAGNNPVYEEVLEDVDDVLVAPGPRSDVIDSNRPDGVKVAWTLHFPKAFTGSLRGALVAVRGMDPAPVIGDPQPYTAANTPTRWNRPAELELVEG